MTDTNMKPIDIIHKAIQLIQDIRSHASNISQAEPAAVEMNCQALNHLMENLAQRGQMGVLQRIMLECSYIHRALASALKSYDLDDAQHVDSIVAIVAQNIPLTSIEEFANYYVHASHIPSPACAVMHAENLSKHADLYTALHSDKMLASTWKTLEIFGERNYQAAFSKVVSALLSNTDSTTPETSVLRIQCGMNIFLEGLYFHNSQVKQISLEDQTRKLFLDVTPSQLMPNSGNRGAMSLEAGLLAAESGLAQWAALQFDNDKLFDHSPRFNKLSLIRDHDQTRARVLCSKLMDEKPITGNIAALINYHLLHDVRSKGIYARIADYNINQAVQSIYLTVSENKTLSDDTISKKVDLQRLEKTIKQCVKVGLTEESVNCITQHRALRDLFIQAKADKKEFLRSEMAL